MVSFSISFPLSSLISVFRASNIRQIVSQVASKQNVHPTAKLLLAEKDKDKNRVTIPLSEAFKLAAEGSHEKEGSDSAARSLYQKWFKSDNKVQLPKYGASGSTASNPHWFGMISGDVKGHDEREPSKDKGKSFEPKGAEEKKKDSGSDSPKKTQTPGESKSD